MECLVLLGCAVGLVILVGLISWGVQTAKKLQESIVAGKRRRQEQMQVDIERRRQEQMRVDIEAIAKEKFLMRADLEAIAKEKSLGFPWLAEAYADYFHLQDMRVAGNLLAKPHPARKSAEKVREIASERRIAEKLWRVLKYQLEYYENLFPWLVDFRGEDVEDLIAKVTAGEAGKPTEEPDDAVKKWLTAAEYEKLSTVERNQLALERYWQKKKTHWEIGRDYERYIGYRYESKGYQVDYQGIVKGLEDLGRDLIATKANEVHIIQCKCWSKEKTIHEKHVVQLFGTTAVCYIRESTKHKTDGGLQTELFHDTSKKIRYIPTLVTSTALSPTARDFALAVHVRVIENLPLRAYPCIKCNVSKRTGEKIYHLPLDQQYDRTIIEEERTECYVATVKEAEERGFRRAFRWRGTHDGLSSSEESAEA